MRDKRLPGHPDLILPKYKSVIFVNGCFWHHHQGCRNATIPKSNHAFWAKKLARNVARDAEVHISLAERGWNILVVWECELETDTLATIERTAMLLRSNTQSETKARYKELEFSKRDLLTVADKKVRYRIRGYDLGTPDHAGGLPYG